MKESLCRASHVPRIRMAEPETWIKARGGAVRQVPDRSQGCPCHDEGKAKFDETTILREKKLREISPTTNGSLGAGPDHATYS